MSAEERGALGGPESAAEHVRNALTMLMTAGREQVEGRDGEQEWEQVPVTSFDRGDVTAIEGRLKKALEIMWPCSTAIASDEMFERLKKQLLEEVDRAAGSLWKKVEQPRAAGGAAGTRRLACSFCAGHTDVFNECDETCACNCHRQPAGGAADATGTP